MNPFSEYTQIMTRRHFFGRGAAGIGATALASLMNPGLFANEREKQNDGLGLLGSPHIAPRAKQMIYIFQTGGPAQMEMYDYKPKLDEFHGQELPASVLGKQRLTGFVSGQKALRVVASPFKFAQYGESGAWVSELLPHMGQVVDDLCFVKSMHTEAINHDPAVTFLLTGSQQAGMPSIGAWLSYGLGSENQNLPAFVVLLSAGQIADASTPLSTRNWGSGILPSRHQGVQFRAGTNPVLYLSNPPGIDSEMRRRMLDVGAQLNRMRLDAFGDPEINTRIAQYEMAYRMQTSVPDLTNMSDEPQHVFDMYGPDARTPGSYAANCLLARRLIEAGVRFVQVFDRDWDHHRAEPIHMRTKTRQSDQPTAALIRDLKQRGLLDDTLVVCGGEFGRSVYSQGAVQENYGRDHHGRCFTMWLAGGGIKPGMTLGETDDYCFNIVDSPVHVHDLNATILHCLGIDHEQLTFKYQGRYFRLTDVHGELVPQILA